MAGQTKFHTGDGPLFLKHNPVRFVDPARHGIFLYSGMLPCFFLALLPRLVSRARRAAGERFLTARRRSASRTSWTASFRLRLASVSVRPCVFTPGISST